METHEQTPQPRTRNRGFASMDQHRQREIARKGGRAAHEKGKAHEFTPDEARAAGRKGGEKVSVNRKHMAEIGRRGGRSSAARRRPGGNAAADMSRHEPRGATHEQETSPQHQPVAPQNLPQGESSLRGEDESSQQQPQAG